MLGIAKCLSPAHGLNHLLWPSGEGPDITSNVSSQVKVLLAFMWFFFPPAFFMWWTGYGFSKQGACDCMHACIFLLLYSQLCVFTFARSPSSLLPVHQARASLQYTHPTDRCKHASGSLNHSMARKMNALVLFQTDTAVHPTLSEVREILFSLKNRELIHTLINYPALPCFNHLCRTFC